MKKLCCAVFVIILCLAISACGDMDFVGEPICEKRSVENSKNEMKQGKTGGKLDVLNHDSFANAENLYTTDKYICYIGNGVQRYDKVTGASTSITDAHAKAVGVTKEAAYYIETSSQYPMLYRISDALTEAEYLYRLSGGKDFFMEGKYIYSVTENGSVIRNRNDAKKYQDSKKVICAGTSGGGLREIKIYRGYIYYAAANGDLSRVSLSDGKTEIICTDLSVSGVWNRPYYICDEKIVLVKDEGSGHDFRIFSINLDGSGEKEITSVRGTYYYFVANKALYAFVKGIGFSRVDLETEEYTLLGWNDSGVFHHHSKELSDIGTGIAYGNANRVMIFDYNGNQMMTLG